GTGVAGPLTSEFTFIVTVTPPNDPPVLTPIGAKVAVVGQPLTFTITADDPNANDPLQFGATGLPPTATFASRTFTWTPPPADLGTTKHVTFTVTDSGGLSDAEAIAIVVRTSNAAPVLAPVGNRTVAEGQSLTIALSGFDADGDPLTYSMPSSLAALGARLDP